jgi:purine-nucleoside phosphorylase
MPIHIRAKEGEVAKNVLLPGNPDRAKYIAEKFLKDAKLYTDYRQMFGYTGTYNGVQCSVQATGMGAPSAGIVIEELLQLKAENFIRIGTCGSLQPNIGLSSTILVNAACPLDGCSMDIAFPGFVPTSDIFLNNKIIEMSEKLNIPVKVGNVGTMNLFYDSRTELIDKMEKFGILALEMECAIIFTILKRENKKACALLTVSDLIKENKRADPSVIAKGVDNSVILALEAFVSIS